MIAKTFKYHLWLPVLALSFFMNIEVNGEIKPSNNSSINQTQVLFEVDELPQADTYKLYITNTDHPENSFEITTQSLACLIRSGFSFGQKYSWYYEAISGNKVIYKSQIYHFTITTHFLVSPKNFHYKISNADSSLFNNNLIFLDNIGVVINRKGEPVWYMPADSVASDHLPQYRNMTISKTGTITFFRKDECYETDLTGRVLWMAPNDGKISGDKTEYYHHDFLKLNDGNYLTCSYKYDTSAGIKTDKNFNKVRYNTLILYNKAGEPIWWWNEKKHITDADIVNASGGSKDIINGTHLNGFIADEKRGIYILSFRNSSTLCGIDKKTGDIVFSLCGKDKKVIQNGIAFNGQHSPVITSEDNLVVYNNNVEAKNTGEKPPYPSVLLLSVPVSTKFSILKLWEYECVMPDYPEGLSGKEGYAEQLSNKNILICIGGANKIMEVTPQKKKVWEMNCEVYDSAQKKWVGFNNYRTHSTSSLYPWYFTVQQPAKFNTGNKVTLKINNDGSENDVYEIIIHYKNKTKKLTPVAINAFQSKTISFDGAPYRSTAGYSITIKPVGVEGKSIVISR